MPNAPPRYNIAPTSDVLVVRSNLDTHERSLDVLRWGLVPHWAGDLSIARKLVNARADSVATKPAFRQAFAKRRCLVPADAFYEWQDGPAPKQPYLIRLKGSGPFAFAGLWEGWQDEASGEWLRTFTIITTDANDIVRPIHSRMPVILDPDDYPAWLGETSLSPEELDGLMKPYPGDLMEAFAIGRAIGNVKLDDPSLMQPIATK